MSEVMPFVVAGIVTGTIFGLAATGLVLTYKTSRLFNFGHGAIGAAGAYLFYELRDVNGWPWILAFVVSVGVAAPLLGILLASVSDGLSGASTAQRIVATVGILLATQSAIDLRYGLVPLAFDSPFPTDTFEFLGTRVGYDQLITMVLSAGAVAVLTVVFRRTHIGLQMRAVVDNPELLSLGGTAPRRIQRVSWIIGAAFAVMTGILFAPTVGLDAILLTLLVVQVVGAAAVGRFSNLGATFVGGLGIGVVQSLMRSPEVQGWVPGLASLPGLPQSVAFFVLFGVLLLSKRGAFQERAVPSTPAKRGPARRGGAVVSARTLTMVVGAAAIVLVPHLITDRYPDLIQTAVFVMIFASIQLLMQISGQVSLCHAAFVAVGATSFTHFTTGAGLPWAVGVVLAGLVVVPLGAVVAIPAIRVSGLFLALATFGFGIVLEQLAYSEGFMFGTFGSRQCSRPDVFGLAGDIGYFYLCCGFAAVSIGAVLVVRRARLGRLLSALADSPTALVTHGTSINVTRVMVFCLSAMMAGIAGALFVGTVGSVSAVGLSAAALTYFNSLLWVVVLTVMGRSAIGAPIVAALLLFLMPSFVSNPDTTSISTAIVGLLVIVKAAYGPRFGGLFERLAAEGQDRRRHTPVAARVLRSTAPQVVTGG